VKYGFIAEHERQFGVSEMCAVLGVSRSGYYDWHGRSESHHAKQDRELLGVITEVFNQERKKYGSPRIHQRLRQLGRRHSAKRIARLMAQNGLFARKQKRRVITTQANPTHQHAPNLLNRDFHAEQPNRKWVSDITQIPTQEGDVYLATTMDLYSRMIVGWAMDEHMDASLTRRAFRMAVGRRCPQSLPVGVLHHSDQGSQYSDGGFRADLANASGVQSMSRKGNVWDNAVMESFFATLDKELLADHDFDTRAQAKTEVFEWIEADYNRRRLHSTLGYLSPFDFEAKHWHAATSAV
jgi:transposase InsO family protein